jgi:hypothetical protein
MGGDMIQEGPQQNRCHTLTGKDIRRPRSSRASRTAFVCAVTGGDGQAGPGDTLLFTGPSVGARWYRAGRKPGIGCLIRRIRLAKH